MNCTNRFLYIFGMSFSVMLAGISAHAQIYYGVGGSKQSDVATGGTYTQNFNTLTNLTTAQTFQNNPTADATNGLKGWYSSSATAAKFSADNGGNNAGSLYSYGATSATDRALGTLYSSSTGVITFGVQITNNTASALTQFTLSYLGEQWRAGNVSAQTLAFSYSSDATDYTNGTYKSDGLLSYTSTINNTSGNTNGSLLASKQLSDTVSGFTLNPNSSLWLRWTASKPSNGSANGLAVDNLSFSASGDTTPAPPGVVSAGIGFAVTGMSALLRRRKQSRATELAEATA